MAKNKKEKFSLKEYFKGVKLEVSKVVWPTKQEIIAYTGVVFGTVAVCTLLFWGIDLGVQALLQHFLG